MQSSQEKQWFSGLITFILAVIAFINRGLTLILAWISNHMLSKVWDEITYPFLNFHGCTVEV